MNIENVLTMSASMSQIWMSFSCPITNILQTPGLSLFKIICLSRNTIYNNKYSTYRKENWKCKYLNKWNYMGKWNCLETGSQSKYHFQEKGLILLYENS